MPVLSLRLKTSSTANPVSSLAVGVLPLSSWTKFALACQVLRAIRAACLQAQTYPDQSEHGSFA